MCGTQIKTVFKCVYMYIFTMVHQLKVTPNILFYTLKNHDCCCLPLPLNFIFFFISLFFSIILFYFFIYFLFRLANTNHFHTFRQRVLMQNSIICIGILHISQHLHNNTNNTKTSQLFFNFVINILFFGGFSSNIFPLFFLMKRI